MHTSIYFVILILYFCEFWTFVTYDPNIRSLLCSCTGHMFGCRQLQERTGKWFSRRKSFNKMSSSSENFYANKHELYLNDNEWYKWQVYFTEIRNASVHLHILKDTYWSRRRLIVDKWYIMPSGYQHPCWNKGSIIDAPNVFCYSIHDRWVSWSISLVVNAVRGCWD